MKKGFFLFSALFLLAVSGAFARVTAVNEGGVVKVTWTYTNPDATFVGLVGDFQGWNLGGASPMTRDANGVWTITLDSTPTAEFKYKFNVDDEWTEDPEAPAGADDGFGGTNGWVIVSEVLAAASLPPGTVAAPAVRGLAYGLFWATWATFGFATENPITPATDGFEFDRMALNNKAYFKFDGYIFPGLFYGAGEIKLFDGAINLYRKELVYDATIAEFMPTVTTTWETGLQRLGSLPWTMFDQWGANWEKDGGLQGKFRGVLELADLNTKIAHSVGWSKTAIQKVDGSFLTYWKDPDANGGVTEIFPINDFDFGGLTLDYFVNLDYSSASYRSNIFAFVDVAGASIDLGATLNTNSAAIDKDFAKNLDTHLFFDASYSLEGLTLALQAKYRMKNNTTLVDPYFVGARLGYTMEDVFSASADFRLAGADANTGFADADDAMDGKAKSTVSFTYFINDDMNVGLTNQFAATNAFKSMTDTIELAFSYTAGDLVIQPAVRFALPLESTAKFDVNRIKLGVDYTGLVTDLYWVPSNMFETNDIRFAATYALTADMGLSLGVSALLDKNDKNNLFGATIGYNLKTPWEAVKNPYMFATFDYNLSAMDGDDNYLFGDIDGSDFAVSNGSALRVGLRWNF